MKKLQPVKVQKILCPKCKELQIKIYPWSNILYPPTQVIPHCKLCINKDYSKSNSTLKK